MSRYFLLLSCVCVAELAFVSAEGLSYRDLPITEMMEVDEFECPGAFSFDVLSCLEGKSLLQSWSRTTSKGHAGLDFMLDPKLQEKVHENLTSHGPLTPKDVILLQPHDAVFHSYVQKHGREYALGTPAYDMRKKLFMQRAAAAAMHNSKSDRRWTAGVNKLADRSEAELRAMLGWSGKASASATSGDEGMAPSFLQLGAEPMHSWGTGASRKLPADHNWSHLNSTHHVHQQGPCGSCWAVSSVSVLQAHMEIHRPQQARPLSVQELVSCVANPKHCGGEGACDGATAELAMDYVMKYGLGSSPTGLATGAEPEAVLPQLYDAWMPEPEKCPVQAQSPILLSAQGGFHSQVDLQSPGVRYGAISPMQEGRAIGIKAWERLPTNSYAPLMHALYERGPASVGVFAAKWFPYSHGIFDSCEKDAVIDHAVALLGYGNDKELGAMYWTVQNSWGPEWGEHGHIRLLREHNDETDYCGTDSQPKEGTGCDGGPAQVKVCGMCGILYDNVVPHF